MKNKKILLIEKSPIVVQGLTEMLNESPGFEVAAVSDSLDRIAERLIVVKPDLIILNPQLVDYSKRGSLRALFQECPQVPIVALVYNYFDQQWLRSFNGIIEINSSFRVFGHRGVEIVEMEIAQPCNLFPESYKPVH